MICIIWIKTYSTYPFSDLLLQPRQVESKETKVSTVIYFISAARTIMPKTKLLTLGCIINVILCNL